jgi:hypothetical protein
MIGTFAQIPLEAMLGLKGQKYLIFSFVAVEEFLGGGVCKLTPKQLSDKYPPLGAYDNLSRYMKEMVESPEGWLIKVEGGYKTKSFEPTANFAVEREEWEKAFLDALVNHRFTQAKYEGDWSPGNVQKYARTLEKFASAEGDLLSFYRENEIDGTAKIAVLKEEAAKIAVERANELQKSQSKPESTAKIAVKEAGETAEIAADDCENRRNESCKYDLDFKNLNTQVPSTPHTARAHEEAAANFSEVCFFFRF